MNYCVVFLEAEGHTWYKQINAVREVYAKNQKDEIFGRVDQVRTFINSKIDAINNASDLDELFNISLDITV
jgi:hypothetical protein